MINTPLFEKYKNIKFVTPKSLFEPDLLWACKNKRCPYCFNKLYPMRKGPLWYCKSKKHKNRFVIHRDKFF